jgi:hypothetical protein
MTDVSEVRTASIIRTMRTWNLAVVEQFCFYKELEETTTGEDFCNVLNEYLKTVVQQWLSYVGICADGALSMALQRDFCHVAKKINERLICIISTHRFLHRETFIAETIRQYLKIVLHEVIETVNCIKGRQFQSRLLVELFTEGFLACQSHTPHWNTAAFWRPLADSYLPIKRGEMAFFFILKRNKNVVIYCQVICGARQWLTYVLER